MRLGNLWVSTVSFPTNSQSLKVKSQKINPQKDRSVAVPASEAAASGLKPDQVHINEKYGGGYPANVEGLHHLHCLNLVRQSLYYNYDYYHEKGEGAFKNDDNIVRFHVCKYKSSLHSAQKR
jgi:hypothetical protein